MICTERHIFDNQPKGTHWERDEQGLEFYSLVTEKTLAMGGRQRTVLAPFVTRNGLGSWSAFQNGSNPEVPGIERFETAEEAMQSLNDYKNGDVIRAAKRTIAEMPESAETIFDRLIRHSDTSAYDPSASMRARWGNRVCGGAPKNGGRE